MKLANEFSNVEREVFAFVMNFGRDNKEKLLELVSKDETALNEFLKDEEVFLDKVLEKGNSVMLDEDKY